MSEVKLDLNEEIYKKLEEISNERGVSIEATIKWLLGDSLRMYYPQPINIPPPPSSSISGEAEEFEKILKIVIKNMVGSGFIKCFTCTTPLNYYDICKGECPSCGSKL